MGRFQPGRTVPQEERDRNRLVMKRNIELGLIKPGTYWTPESIAKHRETMKNKNIGKLYNTASGYVFIKTAEGFERYHRYLMEQQLGRKLLPGEIVHHIDGKKSNNDISNLVLVSGGNSEHLRLHRHTPLPFAKTGQWSVHHDCCVICGKTDSPHNGRGVCGRCYLRLWKTEPERLQQLKASHPNTSPKQVNNRK